MADRTTKAATTRRSSAKKATGEKTGDTTTAAEIEVGDKIYFPNSRHPQEITSVARVTEEDGTETVRLNAIDVQWALKGDAPVRKEA